MLIHLDTTVLVDAFSGGRHSLPAVRTATARGDSLTFSTIVLYEWLRGPRTAGETSAVDAFFAENLLAVFGNGEAQRPPRSTAGSKALDNDRPTWQSPPAPSTTAPHSGRSITTISTTCRGWPSTAVKVPDAICNLQSEMM